MSYTTQQYQSAYLALGNFFLVESPDDRVVLEPYGALVFYKAGVEFWGSDKTQSLVEKTFIDLTGQLREASWWRRPSDKTTLMAIRYLESFALNSGAKAGDALMWLYVPEKDKSGEVVDDLLCDLEDAVKHLSCPKNVRSFLNPGLGKTIEDRVHQFVRKLPLSQQMLISSDIKKAVKIIHAKGIGS